MSTYALISLSLTYLITHKPPLTTSPLSPHLLYHSHLPSPQPYSFTQTCACTGVKRSSRLFLADLGGSEQVKKSQVDAGVNRIVGEEEAFSLGFQLGEHMREAVYINLGLLALKKCIEALNNDQPYVPYQDSKLTMLLSSGLGGNSKTAVLIACSSNSSGDPPLSILYTTVSLPRIYLLHSLPLRSLLPPLPFWSFVPLPTFLLVFLILL